MIACCFIKQTWYYFSIVSPPPSVLTSLPPFKIEPLRVTTFITSYHLYPAFSLLLPSMIPLYFLGFCNYLILYNHIWGFGARSHRWVRTCGFVFWDLGCWFTLYNNLLYVHSFTWQFHDFISLYCWIIFIVYMCHIFIIHSYVEWHLDCFHFQLLWVNEHCCPQFDTMRNHYDGIV